MHAMTCQLQKPCRGSGAKYLIWELLTNNFKDNEELSLTKPHMAAPA
jgi:hypothetical protein